MFVKLTIFACLVVAATAVWNGPLAGGVPASQFPAGVSPQACPNYPNCHNPAVAANPAAPAQYGGYNPAPQYNQWNPAPVPQQWNNNGGFQSALDRGEYTGDGDYHGEGLAESGAYGNQGGYDNGQYNAGAWNNGQANAGAWNGGQANAGAWNNPGAPAAIPAGVDPHSCPNYPFCH